MNIGLHKVITVIGTGRSGTSLLMQILKAFGMETSENLIEASEQNPLGGFEDRFIFDIQTQALKSLGINHFLTLQDGWLETKPIKQSIMVLNNYLQEQILKTDTIWGFKDPKTSFLLPMWLKVFNMSKVVPLYILALRNPASFVSSMERQYSQNPLKSEMAWLGKNCDSLRYTGGNVFIIHYEDWFTEKSVDMVKKLLHFTGLKDYFKGNIPAILSSIIKPNLNRAQHDRYEIKNRWVNSLYDQLKSCSFHDFDRLGLMKTVREVTTVMNEFKGWSIATHDLLQEKQQHIDFLNNNINKFNENISIKKKIKNEVNFFKMKLTALEGFQEEFVEAQSTLKSEIENLRSSNNKYRLDLALERANVKSLKNDLEETRQQVKKETQQIVYINGIIERIENENLKLNSANNEHLSDLSKERGKNKILRKDLEEVICQNNDYLKEIKDYYDEVSNLRISVKNINKAKNTTQKRNFKKQIQELERVHTVLQKKLNKFEKEAFNLSTSYSFRFGQVFVNAVAKPGKNTIMLPFRLVGLVLEPVAILKNMLLKKI